MNGFKTLLGIATMMAAFFGMDPPAAGATPYQLIVFFVGVVLAIVGRLMAKGPLVDVPAKPPAAPPAAPLLLLLALTLGACGSCPVGTAENADNVRAIVSQNTAYAARSDAAESIKAADAIRNREALALAEKLAAECAR